MNSSIWPYKWGLRFHPSVNLSILKFLAFEQVFKNSLTTLPMWWGKWWSDFDPKWKSDNEIMKFCQSFMTELFKYIGPETDVPAWDIWVGAREIGFLFWQYKRIVNQFDWVLTGKAIDWGGSLIRPEATWYGTIYFLQEMLKTKNDWLKGKIVAISWSWNVAQYATEKLIQLWAKVTSMSDSNGYIYDKSWINEEKLAYIKDLKNIKRWRISEYTQKFKVKYVGEGTRPWWEKIDIALPCATQNEICWEDARELIKNWCKVVVEWSNMSSTLDSINIFLENKILYSPGKASNAGWVSVSWLEMTQNAMKLSWSAEEVDKNLHAIMKKIHETCVCYGKEKNYINYIKWANIWSFVKVANAMLAQWYV